MLYSKNRLTREAYRAPHKYIRPMMRNLSCGVALFIAATAFASTKAAAYSDWTGTVSNDWFDPDNWAAGVIPVAGDGVNIWASTGPVQLTASTAVSSIYLGLGAGSVAELDIRGVTTEIGTDFITVGHQGTSTLRILEGARVSTGTFDLNSHFGSTSDENANLLISGANSALNADRVLVSYNGPSRIEVSDGGAFNFINFAMFGYGIQHSEAYEDVLDADGTAFVHVTGAGSSMTGGTMLVGNGEFIIDNGASAHFGTTSDVIMPLIMQGDAMNIGVLGFDVRAEELVQRIESSASALISGEGTVVVAEGDVSVAGYTYRGLLEPQQVPPGYTDLPVTGELTIADRAQLQVSGNLRLTGEGTVLNVATLNIGTGGKAGSVTAGAIIGGDGSATVNFNHTDIIEFAVPMHGKLAINQIGAGTTILTGANDYTGDTTISGGSLLPGNASAFSAVSNYVLTGGTLNINGFNITVGSLANGGTVVLNGCDTCAGNTLTVTGDYTGNGGVISIGTVLGDDVSLTDKLVIEGNSSGTSIVQVTNEKGAGALTREGIEIITIGGDSSGTFTLQNGYVVAGAYTYRLYKGNASGSDAKDWYLRSALTPVDPQPEYHVGSPVYETYAQSLLGMNGVATLQQRVGNRVWAGNGNRVIAQGADAVQPEASAVETGQAVEGNGVWGRVEGTYSHIEPKFSTADTDYNQNVFKLQAGIDGKLSESENGALIGGVFVHYVHGKTKTSSTNYADGEIASDGYGFGGTLTWYGDKGFYVDAQAQATWYSSDLTTSALAAPTLKDGNDGFGYALSLEAGQRFAVNEAWSLTPQAQLVYSRVDFDSFTDGFGSPVGLDKGDSLQGRIGLTLDHASSWQNANGGMDRANVYGIVNLYNEFLDGTRVDLAGVSLASKKDRTWGGIGAGGSYNWDNDKYSIYGEGLINTSLNNLGDSYSVKGNIGFRVKW